MITVGYEPSYNLRSIQLSFLPGTRVGSYEVIAVRKTGEELGVGTVLEGSVRRAGARVRVTAQLVDAASGTHLWSQRYDRDISDIFAVPPP